jgi:hypothetical protein
MFKSATIASRYRARTGVDKNLHAGRDFLFRSIAHYRSGYRLVLSIQTFRCDTNRLRVTRIAAVRSSLGFEKRFFSFRYLLCNDLLALPKVGVRLGTSASGLTVALYSPGGESVSCAPSARTRPQPRKQAVGDRMQKLFRKKENWKPKRASALFQ